MIRNLMIVPSELCGFECDDRGAFPIEAYYAFCEKRGIPFPLEWRPKEQQIEKGTAPIVPGSVVPALSPEDAEVVDGLTVATLRKVFDHSPALRDIVTAVAEWQKPTIDGGELSRRSVNEIQQLKQAVETKAAAGNWGTDNGKLSEPQGRLIERLIFGRSGGGSGNSSVWYGARDKTKKKG